MVMVMVARGGGGRRAGGMKTHVREDHPGVLQEDHLNSVSSVPRPHIGTPLELQHDNRFLACKQKGSRTTILRRSVDRRLDFIPPRRTCCARRTLRREKRARRPSTFFPPMNGKSGPRVVTSRGLPSAIETAR